jgi:iduronate 2-sulfatase
VGNFTTLPQYFKQNGYETISVGKIFHPGISSNFTDDYPLSWSDQPYHPPTEKYKDAPVCIDTVTKRLQRNLICPVNVKEQPGKSLPDLQSLKYAINFLKHRKASSKPFLLAVGFHKPHIPLKFPQHYISKYKSCK